MRAARPGSTSTETASMVPEERGSAPPPTQLPVMAPGPHCLPWALPAAQTKIAFSAAPACAIAAIASPKPARRSASRVVVDDAFEADAQVQDVHALRAVPPRQDPVEPRRPRGVYVLSSPRERRGCRCRPGFLREWRTWRCRRPRRRLAAPFGVMVRGPGFRRRRSRRPCRGKTSSPSHPGCFPGTPRAAFFPLNIACMVSMPLSMKPMVTPAPAPALSPSSRLTWA